MILKSEFGEVALDEVSAGVYRTGIMAFTDTFLSAENFSKKHKVDVEVFAKGCFSSTVRITGDLEALRTALENYVHGPIEIVK